MDNVQKEHSCPLKVKYIWNVSRIEEADKCDVGLLESRGEDDSLSGTNLHLYHIGFPRPPAVRTDFFLFTIAKSSIRFHFDKSGHSNLSLKSDAKTRNTFLFVHGLIFWSCKKCSGGVKATSLTPLSLLKIKASHLGWDAFFIRISCFNHDVANLVNLAGFSKKTKKIRLYFFIGQITSKYRGSFLFWQFFVIFVC